MGSSLLNRFFQSWLACLLAVTMLTQGLGRQAPLVRTDARQTLAVTGEPVLNRRVYLLNNGDSVCMGRLQTSAAGDAGVAVEQLSVSDAEGTVRYYDSAAKQWISQPAAEGRYYQEMLLLCFGSTEFFFYTPKTYRPLPNNGLEHLPQRDGYLELRQTQSGWELTLTAQAPEAGCYADYVSLRSQAPLMDLTKANTHELWMRKDVGRWCYDGYYRPAPTTYVPTGENVYYRCAASYLLKSFTQTGDVHRVAADLARCMLDAMTLYQTEDGCWLTPSKSEWLSGDYNIGAGFYDTRFNTDLIQTMVLAYERYGGESLRDSLNQYGDFFLRFSEQNHTETAGGGWLVDDYWSPDGGNRTHTSLNHQVAECDALYRMAATLNRPDLARRADQMLAGIRDTGAKWLRPDGNLHYAVYVDGSYGGTDYPDLTYNDMFTLRALLKEQGRPDEPVLVQLMAAKKGWMDMNGVTSYLK